MSCFLCKKSGLKLVNFNKAIFGPDQNTIKADVTELVGREMADIIDDSACFCIVCIHVLDNFVKLKQSVMTIILNPEATFTALTPGLGPFWHFVAQNIKKKDPDIDYYNPSPPVTNVTARASPSTSFSQENSSRGATPLLFVTNVKTYNESLERFVENRERIRSESRRETALQSETIGKKRGRSNENRSDSTIRRMRDDIISSLSEHSSRPVSTTSEMSIVSYKGDDDRRSKSRSRSRGSRKAESYFADFSALEVSRKKEVEESGFVCPLSDCKNNRQSFTISNYNKHMRDVHKRMCLYRCAVCGNEYFTKEQLDFHRSEKHDVSPVICRMCLKAQENVRCFQAHLDEHFRHQKCCSLCDLSFLTKKDLNNHIYVAHRRKGVDSKRTFTDTKQKVTIKQVIIHKPKEVNCLPVTNNDRYTSRRINIKRNANSPEEFRSRNFKELFHIQKERRNKRTVNGLRYVGARNRKLFPLGDSIYYNESLDDAIHRSEACFPSPYTSPTEDEDRPPTRSVALYDQFHFAYDDDVSFVDDDDEVEEINRYHSGRSELGSRPDSGRTSRFGMCDSRMSQYSYSQDPAVQKMETDSEDERELNTYQRDEESADSEPRYYGDFRLEDSHNDSEDSDQS